MEPMTMPTEPVLKKSNHALRWVGGVILGLIILGAVAGDSSTPSSGSPSPTYTTPYSSSTDHTSSWTSGDNSALIASIATIDNITAIQGACMVVYVESHYYPWEVKNSGSKTSESATSAVLACS